MKLDRKQDLNSSTKFVFFFGPIRKNKMATPTSDLAETFSISLKPLNGIHSELLECMRGVPIGTEFNEAERKYDLNILYQVWFSGQ